MTQSPFATVFSPALPHRKGSPPEEPGNKGQLRGTFFLIGLGIFATTLGNPLWTIGGGPIGGLPLNIFLKETLGLDPEGVARFISIVGFPWYFKPVAGVLCDSIPFCGYRRRNYLLLSSAGACLLWLVLGSITPTYTPLLVTVMALSTFVMFASTATGGLIVETGQRYNANGRVSAIRVGIKRFCDLLGGPLGGWLAGRALIFLSVLGAILQFALFVATLGFLGERSVSKRPSGEAWIGVKNQCRNVLGSTRLWVASGLIFLVLVEPGFGTLLLFYQRDTLGFSTGFIGLLGVVTAASGILGALIYARLCSRISIRILLAGGIVCHVIGTLFFLAYASRESAILVSILSGLFLALSTVPLLDLASRATPKGSEALGYSVVASMMNIAVVGSNYAGSWLHGHFNLNFRDLVWINSGTTFLVLFAVPFLPATTTDESDR